MNYTLGNTLLKIEDVSLSFGDNLILRDINLEVKDIIRTDSIAGQVITLLGKSGVGKTQLLKMIAGLQTPTKGKVLITEELKEVQAGEVGMVLQTYPMFEHRTLLGNMELVSKDKEKINFLLNEFSIEDHKNKYPCQLSGGQRQRGAIVQQLLCSEHFILLDEPFSGLDPVATEKLCQNISRIANLDEKNTVIISSHILEPSLAISDSVLIMGHEYDIEACIPPCKIPGAKILYQENLAAKGLAWQPEIRKDRRFVELCENIRQTFQTL